MTGVPSRPKPRSKHGATLLVLAGLVMGTSDAARADDLLQLAQQSTVPGTVTPAPSVTTGASSATCLSGCNSQSFNCQNTCISTINGTTVVPSVTIVGATTIPGQCQQNCSTQLQVCQQNCAMQ